MYFILKIKQIFVQYNDVFGFSLFNVSLITI